MPWGDRVDDASLDDLVREFARRPVGHRATTLLGMFTGHGDDLGELLRREGRRRSRAQLIREQLIQQVREVLVACPLLFGLGQALLVLEPSGSPTASSLSVDTQPAPLLGVAHAFGAKQDVRAPLDQLCGGSRLVLLPALQDGALPFGDDDRCCFAHCF